MAPYVILLLALILFRDVSLRTWQYNRLIFIAFIVVLSLFIGFRKEIGCDWLAYSLYEDRYSTIGNALTMRDPGFQLVGTLLKMVGLPFFPWMNFVTGLVVLMGCYVLTRNRAENLLFLAIIFAVVIVALAMSGLRQAFALGIVLFSLDRLLASRYIVAFGLCILAATFHTSAIMFSVFLIFALRMNPYLKAAILVLLPVIIFAATASSESAEVALERYSSGEELQSEGTLYRLGFLLLLSIPYVVYLRRHLFADENKIRIFTDLSLMCLLLLTAAATVGGGGISSIVMDRIGLYLWPFITLGIITGLPYLDTGKRYMLAWGYQTVSLAYFVSWSQWGNKFYGCYAPYQSFLF